MKTLYVTYFQNGLMRRSVLSQRQYETYLRDKSISDLQIHGSQNLMETFYNSSNNINRPVRQILLG